MRKGYTLVNYLLSLFVIFVFLNLAGLIFKLMINHSTPTIHQNELFELQLLQLYVRTNNITCQESSLTIDSFEIIFDRNRIVKRPGYEILLQEVDAVNISCTDSFSLHYKYKGTWYELAFKKPQG